MLLFFFFGVILFFIGNVSFHRVITVVFFAYACDGWRSVLEYVWRLCVVRLLPYKDISPFSLPLLTFRKSSLGFRYASKCQCPPGPYTQQYNQHRLHGVYYKHEVQCFFFRYAVEYKHRLDGKMPWSGTVGSWNHDGYAANHECHQGAGHAKVGGKVKAEESQVVVQKIARPYPDREQGEQRYVAYMPHRQCRWA